MIRVAPFVLTVAIGAGVLQTPVPVPPPPPPQAQMPARDPGGAPQAGTSAILGTVMTADSSGQPVRRATVNVSGGGLRAPRQAITDSSGRYLIADLPSGTFNVSVTKPSFIGISYGAKQPGQSSTPIVLAPGQRFVADVRMPKGSVITGTVFDPYGRPRPQIRVQAMQYRTQGGQRRLLQTGSGSFVTDDRGVYRIYGLLAGDFIVFAVPQEMQDVPALTSEELHWAQSGVPSNVYGATPPPPPAAGPSMGFAAVYFPGVVDISSATTITLSAGEERAAVDFQLRAVPTAKVLGVLVEPSGAPLQQVTLTMLPEDRLRSGMPQLGLASEYGRFESETGKFTFSSVTPGRYTVMARSNVRIVNVMPPPPPPMGSGGDHVVVGQPASTTTLWAMTQVDVDGRDVTNLALTLRPGLSISGRVVFEASTATPPADLTRVRLSASQIDTSPLAIGISGVGANLDGTFTLRGATPGRYRLGATVQSTPGTPPGQWIVKSIVADGRDTLDTGLDMPPGDIGNVVVTFTDKITDLSGTLLDAAGTPAKDLWVLCFSTDSNYWTPQSRRVRVLRPNADGKYRFSQWMPGEYFLAAVTDGDQIDLTDRAAMEQIAAVALRITLAEGEKKVQDLKVAR